MLAPERRIVLEGVGAEDDVLLLPSGRVVYSVTDETNVTRFYSRGVEGEATHLAELEGGAPFIAACEDGAFFALGTGTGVMIVEVGESGPVTEHRHDFTLGAPPFESATPVA